MADTDKLVEQLSNLSVLEIAGLVKQLEEIVFHHVHFRACWRQSVPQFAEISDLHVLIIGHKHERRALQFIGQICNYAGFFGSHLVLT